MTKTPRLLLLPALISLAVLGACGGNDDNLASATTTGLERPTTTAASGEAKGEGDEATATTAPVAPAATVILKTLAFTPKEASIKKGEAVRWVFDDGSIVHNVSGKDFKSGNKDKGDFVHVFTKTGAYAYTCTLHPGMDGQVTVT